jgi:aerobic carbon-monoxide dehydrogenase medium subunit
VKPAPFEYLAVETLAEASAALQQNGPDAKLLAGGQSLVPLLNFRLVKPKLLIDLNDIAGCDHIDEIPGGVSVGALARQSKVERSPLINERCPLIAEAVRHIGHVAIRHRGTIGGSLVHGDPAAELPAVALALEADFQTIRNGATRTIAAGDFFVDYLTTALYPDEILESVVFPRMPRSLGYAVEELTRRHGDFAIAGVIATVACDEQDRIADARLALFGVAPTAVRARHVEMALKNQTAELNVIHDAVALLDNVLDPSSDMHASAAYRKRVARVLTIRALAKAVQLCRSRRLE